MNATHVPGAAADESAAERTRASVGPEGRTERYDYTEKLEPQPQLLVALGLLKTNPRPMISSLKSISVPLR